MPRRVSKPPEDFRRVAPTQQEVREYRRTHANYPPAVYRVQCLACGKRLWGSGIGIVSHRRHCPG